MISKDILIPRISSQMIALSVSCFKFNYVPLKFVLVISNPINSGSENTLEIKLVKVESDEEKTTMKESHAIYNTYQKIIHNDKDCDMKQWSRFLRKNPFQYEDEMGLYHCQYRLNGKPINYFIINIYNKPKAN